jgi:putative hydrolase of the HAD superfamily
MDVAAIAFDVNGTLIEIRTDDESDDAFRAVGHFLTYQGVDLRRHQIRDLYVERLKAQQRESGEQYPEFDGPRIWGSIVDDHASAFTRAIAPERLIQLPLTLSEIYRGVTRRKLKLYPHVRSTLRILRERMPLGIVTDGQSSYARGELHKVGLMEFFDPIVVSGDHGFRKPDRRLFQLALDGMGIPAENALYVGNDMHRDIYGAREIGMGTVMFDSDQGTKQFEDCVPDHRITDFRDLLGIVGV